jgi:hypothetical protein
MTRTISTDQETMELEKELKKQVPDINFSRIYRQALFNLTNKPSGENEIEKARQEINKLLDEMYDKQSKVKMLKRKINQIIEREKKLAKEEEEIDKKDYDKMIKAQAKMFQDYFYLTDTEAIKITLKWKKSKSVLGWIDFGKKQGLKFNESKWSEII